MLKYLFKAIYEDGTILEQTQDDRSLIDPAKSTFFDIDHSKLIAFGLEDGGDTAVVVDLRDGSFQVNGVPFYIYDKEVKDRRLIYFRRNTIAFDQNLAQHGHNIAYHIGWQGNDPVTGENVQRVLSFT